MKKIIFILMMLFASINLSGQTMRPVWADPTPFLGKWRATKDGKVYELTMIRDTMHVENLPYGINEKWDVISCQLIYKQNGNVIRTIEYNLQGNRNKSSLWGSSHTANTAKLYFTDKERIIHGTATFSIVPSTPNAALWVLRKPEIYFVPEGGAADFDIPRELTFLKQSESDGGNAGFEPIDPGGGPIIRP